MPTYRFRRDDSGNEFNQVMSKHVFDSKVVDGKIKLPGSKTTATFVSEVRTASQQLIESGALAIQHPSTWPMWSDSMGINPEQIPEALAYDAANGIKVDYHPDTGAVKFPDRETRKRFCEHHGVYDRNGGYSDPQRNKVQIED